MFNILGQEELGSLFIETVVLQDLTRTSHWVVCRQVGTFPVLPKTPAPPESA